MTGKPFTLYTRTNKKNKKIYYVKFKNPDGSYQTARSTGQTTKIAAEKWSYERLHDAGINGTPLKTTKIQFNDIAENFFDWSGEWATDKKSRGLRIGKRHCQERTDITKRHLLPFFGSYKVTAINRAHIKNFRNTMFTNGYSGSTINKCLSALRAILTSCEENDIINAIPYIDRAADNPKIKGILTVKETQKLFHHQWTTKESFKHPVTNNFIGKTANKLAATTGIRAGEIQALVHSDINLEGNFITVRRSWDTRLRQLNDTTKTGRERNIFIPDTVLADLQFLLSMHPSPDPDAFVFFSERKPNQPVAQRVFTDSLYKALFEIGIDEETRRERNITFHSWRHFVNSLMINSKIPIQKIMRITGHMTQDMVQHYYKVTIDDMQDVKQLQERLFFD